jgi:16S rRNA (cytidine1402-2'-O)-methyltransferase
LSAIVGGSSAPDWRERLHVVANQRPDDDARARGFRLGERRHHIAVAVLDDERRCLRGIRRCEKAGSNGLRRPAKALRRERQHEDDGTGLAARCICRRGFDVRREFHAFDPFRRGRHSERQRGASLAAAVGATDNAESESANAANAVASMHTSRAAQGPARGSTAAPFAPRLAFPMRRKAIIRTGSNFAWLKAGLRRSEERGTRTLRGGAGHIICRRYSARKSARPDVSRGRRPRERRYDRGRGHARDRGAAASLRHRGAAASLHEHNEAARAERIVEALRQGKSVALVSDAGTPAISDPARASCAPCAHAGSHGRADPRRMRGGRAVSAAGLAAERWLFLGFLPSAAKARRELLASTAKSTRRSSSTKRRTACVRPSGIAGRIGRRPARSSSRARSRRSSRRSASSKLAEASEWLAEDPNRERGEFVLLVDAPVERAQRRRSTLASS